MAMVQRKFYLPEALYNQLQIQAKVAGITATALLREFVDQGIKRKKRTSQPRGIQALFGLVRMAEKQGWKAPKDLSVNHNKYFVEAWEKQKGRKRKKT